VAAAEMDLETVLMASRVKMAAAAGAAAILLKPVMQAMAGTAL